MRCPRLLRTAFISISTVRGLPGSLQPSHAVKASPCLLAIARAGRCLMSSAVS